MEETERLEQYVPVPVRAGSELSPEWSKEVPSPAPAMLLGL